MSIDTRHPIYSLFVDDWQMLRHFYSGSKTVKAQNEKYLFGTERMRETGFPEDQGSAGWKMYRAYRERAIIPETLEDAVETLVGIMHQKGPNIILPAKMEPMREKATVTGDSLEVLMRRINAQQWLMGRVCLMLDLPVSDARGPSVTPLISVYSAEKIINWSDTVGNDDWRKMLNLVVINETNNEINPTTFEWSKVEKYRVLRLELNAKRNPEEANSYVYSQKLEYADSNDHRNDPTPKTPNWMGSQFDEIPFVFINSQDIDAEPTKPPLLGLCNIVLGIYRGDADYRQSLFMQGQDTLVVIGGDEKSYNTGSGAVISLDIGGDAKYVGVASSGISEQRESLQNLLMIAEKKAGSFSQKGSGVESGDALRLRTGSQRASITKIALTGAYGLEKLLRTQARLMNLDPEEVKVIPNLDFIDDRMPADTLMKYMTAKSIGAPYSLQSIHERMEQEGLTQYTLEEELSLIDSEDLLLPSNGAPVDDANEEDEIDGDGE